MPLIISISFFGRLDLKVVGVEVVEVRFSTLRDRETPSEFDGASGLLRSADFFESSINSKAITNNCHCVSNAPACRGAITHPSASALSNECRAQVATTSTNRVIAQPSEPYG